MARKRSPLEMGSRVGDEDMFVSSNTKSMHRGRRVAPRTEVCRPCVVHTLEDPGDTRQAVILDLTPYGMRVRMLDRYPIGTKVIVQMMRDDEFKVPLSRPIFANVIRAESSFAGFIDHGLQLQFAKIKRAMEGRPISVARPNPLRRSTTRVYSVDHILRTRRTGRNRG